MLINRKNVIEIKEQIEKYLKEKDTIYKWVGKALMIYPDTIKSKDLEKPFELMRHTNIDDYGEYDLKADTHNAENLEEIFKIIDIVQNFAIPTNWDFMKEVLRKPFSDIKIDTVYNIGLDNDIYYLEDSDIILEHIQNFMNNRDIHFYNDRKNDKEFNICVTSQNDLNQSIALLTIIDVVVFEQDKKFIKPLFPKSMTLSEVLETIDYVGGCEFKTDFHEIFNPEEVTIEVSSLNEKKVEESKKVINKRIEQVRNLINSLKEEEIYLQKTLEENL